MTLAYTFWHQPRSDVGLEKYEADLRRFHERLAAVSIAGFVRSYTLRVPDLAWLPGGGYEDWYLVDDFAALGTLNQAAVDAARLSTHDALANTTSMGHGAGGVYRLVLGEGDLGDGGLGPNWVGWFGKRGGVGYSQLRAELRERVAERRPAESDGAEVSSVWERQMVLGPAPEFRVEATGPIQLRGAELALGLPMTEPVNRTR